MRIPLVFMPISRAAALAVLLGLVCACGQIGTNPMSANAPQDDLACPGDAGDALAPARRACVQAINGYRASLSLPPLKRWCAATGCSDGQPRADAIKNQAHSAFGACSESAQNECPGWPNAPADHIGACLQMMWAEGPGSDFATHGHYINMSSPDHTEVACGFAVSAQNFWAVQDFR